MSLVDTGETFSETTGVESRLKKENDALKQLIKEYQREHESERIALCEEIDGLRQQTGVDV
jgi:hypothetical protein